MRQKNLNNLSFEFSFTMLESILHRITYYNNFDWKIDITEIVNH